MKTSYQIFIGAGCILLFIVGIGIWMNTPKIAFVSHQQLFNGYQGRIDVAQVLEKQQQNQQQKQDSILLETIPDSLKEQYLQKYRYEQQQLQQKAEQYTSQIWEQINMGIVEYGQNNGYDYILGAGGDGSLMYADSSRNITSEVLEYINQRYENQDE